MFKCLALIAALIAVSHANVPYGVPQLPWGGPYAAPQNPWAAPQLPVVPLGGDSYGGSPIPYNFGYDSVDDYGTKQTRSEVGDGSGNVKGSYSYQLGNGVTRIVDYVADSNGFRASVRTNEKGTVSSAPADALIAASPVAQLPSLPGLPRPLY